MSGSWTLSEGVYLADADERRIATVVEAAPDPHHHGCVQASLCGATLEDLSHGSGDWRVIDSRVDACYCVQALRIWDAAPGVGMLVSSLGEASVVSEEADDDFLILPGQEPVGLHSFVAADGQCCHGPHVRCEFDAKRFAGLELSTRRPMVCRCGRPSAIRVADPELVDDSGHWRFVRLGGTANTTVEARIVRLRQRSTTRCRFHVALPKTPCGAAVMIGHAVATEHWHATNANRPPARSATRNAPT
ncbi:MAG: hypothetical protein AAF916_11450 [Planctomycetota bacterium]